MFISRQQRAEEHVADPKPAELPYHARNACEIEKLRLAVGALEVMDGHFDHAKPSALYFHHHLGANDAAVALQVHCIEDAAPDQAKVAVHVA